ncbi:hypothetical protein [Anaeroselena agilis]|uniref:Uncharacterized protein n=1 Tax=Anaeroselena agilis TaxID=3063788 RepID=A0ABU3P4F1_9FIRM|nr:hypothetical protein [Selenomonadales bacterium 4137-cl]
MAIAGLSGSSVEYYARLSAEKETIKNQAANLESAAKKVEDSIDAFSPNGMFTNLYITNKNSSAFRDFSANALRGLVKSYNELNEVSASSDRLSDEGKALLDKAKALFAGPNAELFREMGLEMNAATGTMTFDENRFADRLAADPYEVKRLLCDRNSLGSVLQQVIEDIAARSTQGYFNSSFIINA